MRPSRHRFADHQRAKRHVLPGQQASVGVPDPDGPQATHAADGYGREAAPNTIAQPMWIYPSDLATLQSKFPVNLQTTLCALFHALVDDDTVLLEGQYARELADLSKELNMTITKGRDIVGLAKAYIEVKKSLDEARMQQKVLEPVLKLIGALGGGQQATNGLGALSALLGTGSQQPAIDPDSLALPPQTQFPQIIDPDDPEYYHQQPQAASNQPPPPRPKPLD